MEGFGRNKENERRDIIINKINFEARSAEEQWGVFIEFRLIYLTN